MTIRRAAGMTLIEVLIASAILAFAIAVFLTFESGALHQADTVQERQFAITRATSMIEELKAYVEGGSESHAELLDDFDDGTATNPVLSTQKEVRAPDDPVSGNVRLPGGLWKYTRRVNVSKLAGIDSRDVRVVTVTVFLSNGKQPGWKVLAEVSRVIRTIGSYMPPTQVVDVYALALENVPGWWVNMTTLKPLVENAFNDMEAVNPGLEFRIHWINRLSYGRDPKYAPFINQDADASKPAKLAYWYPGLIDASGYTYYSPSQISGRLDVDGEIVESSRGEANVAGYTLADEFNAAMREPDERAMWEARKAAGFDTEPSLRLLLDDMATRPDDYRNALIVNLHGELLPLPPVRNYSDPAHAKAHPGVRVVTHPERLSWRGYDDVRLRVYSFVTDPDSVPAGATLDDDVVLTIEGVDVHKSLKVTGIDAAYQKKTVDVSTLATFDGRDTILKLPASPLRAAKKGEQGLSPAARLYGWEYIPCPVEAEADFTTELSDAGDGPKNTARWIVTLPGAALPDHHVLAVDTRIGTSAPDADADPWNQSRTFAWIDDDPPPSESAQFQGDPRHEPYADLKLAHRYNWFFGRVAPESGYGGFDRTQDGWAVDKVDLDIPRYFALYRDALLDTDSIFTTMNGFSFFYVGVGGELGSDEPNGYPKGLPLNDLPYGGKGETTTFVSEIHDETRVVGSSDGRWYAKPWLGELFPDSKLAEWEKDGNLPAGEFKRWKLSELPSKPFPFSRKKRTDRFGASAFFNSTGEQNRGPFTHLFDNKNLASATSDGRKLGANFNLNTPPSMSAYRPFVLDGNQNFPPEWKEPEYSRSRLQSHLSRVLYDASQPRDAVSSALMELRDGSNDRASYFVMNGLSPAGIAGTAFMGRYAAITLMEGFMTAGEGPQRHARVAQLPRIVVTSPSEDQELIDPRTITVKWDVTWRRWDGEPYTSYYRDDFQESTPLGFVVKYSTDGGMHWKLARTGAESPAGIRPEASELVGGSSYDWDVSEMPPGPFLVRVEAYRATIPLHYAYHQVRQNIRR